jgi:hypothetical protein
MEQTRIKKSAGELKAGDQIVPYLGQPNNIIDVDPEDGQNIRLTTEAGVFTVPKDQEIEVIEATVPSLVLWECINEYWGGRQGTFRKFERGQLHRFCMEVMEKVAEAQERA